MAGENSVWDEFTNKYGLSKTLRFELKPIGKTLEHVKKNQKGLNLIKEDEERAGDYKKIKKIIDDYHKDFIKKALAQVEFKREDLEDFYDVYKKNMENKEKDPESRKKLREELFEKQKDFREQVREKIERVGDFKDLFNENLIKKQLKGWVESKNYDDLETKKELIEKFQKWTTYFRGFNENRKNVYSGDEIPTSIIYRIVHDNLPKFLDNVLKFEKLKKYFKEGLDFGDIQKELKEELEWFKVKKLEEIFSLSNFNQCLSQKGIENFNKIIGGKKPKPEDVKKKIQGVNECVNLFSQKKQDKKIRSLKMTLLFKQILSDRESASFLDKFEDDKQAMADINEFYEKLREKDENQKNKNLFESLKESFENLKEDDLEKIYLKNDRSLTFISKFIFGDWYFIKESLRYYYGEKFPFKNKEKPTKKEEDAIDDYVEKTNYFSVSELEECIKEYNETLEEKKTEKENPVCDYFSNLRRNSENKEIEILNNVYEKYGGVKEILEKERLDGAKDLIKVNGDVEKIKDFLDSIRYLHDFVKPLYVSLRKKKNEEENQSDVLEKGEFYIEFDDKFEKLEGIVPLYDKVRNYVTQKPYSVEKFKLNFENSTLAEGWDLNKEDNKNYTCIFREGKNYFLGIINTGEDKKILNRGKHPEIFDIKTSSDFEKMEFKDLGDVKRQLPRMAFSQKAEKGEEKINWSESIREIYEEFKNFQKTKKDDRNKWQDEFDRGKLDKLIDYYKNVLKNHSENYEESYGIEYKKPTSAYKNLGEFFDDVASQSYKLNFVKMDKSYVNELVDSGKLYLFKIWNKDFSEHSTGNKNLHTLYWNALFDERNLEEIVYKLNGGAELFYREKSIDAKITHPKNVPVENKDPIDKKESKFKYDLIKDKRFTEDKFLFHCPITMNFKEKERGMNDKIIETIRNDSDRINILSIDRGERHLAYYTLLDNGGKILSQKSFNVISDDSKRKRKVNYQKKLDKLEKCRDEARKNWKTIENIKEMKEGYLSQVVHEISKLVIEKNAIVVFEDLNFGFKRGRFKIEKQVYQKLEKTLIDKLNYLMFKDRTENEPGGLLKAYQLTSKFESFQRLGKQSGLIFYVPSHYTSKICPRTGFVNLLHPKHESIKKSRDFFENFKSIRYDVEKECFEFKFNYENFRGIKNGFDKDWTVCSFGKRLKGFRDKNNRWGVEEIEITEKLKKLFEKYEIEFENGQELRREICKKEVGIFLKELIECLKLVLQMRNSYDDKDYFLSCVADKNGEFFDSRKNRSDEPENADANGAYNVGLKGVMILDKIKNSDDKRPDLKIRNEEFFEFVRDEIINEE